MANNYERKINPSQTTVKKKKEREALLEKNKICFPNSEYYSKHQRDFSN